VCRIYGASGRYNTISSTPFLLLIRAAYASEDRIKNSRTSESDASAAMVRTAWRNCPIKSAGEREG
jgi:hypothetical protein